MAQSYVDVVRNMLKEGKQSFDGIIFSSDIELRAKLSKAYVGVMINLGSSYNIQEIFFSEGYFAIKVTPMGANMCLLEESEEGEIHDLICDAESWWKQWFCVIRPWRENDIDKERVSWIRLRCSLPCLVRRVLRNSGEFFWYLCLLE